MDNESPMHQRIAASLFIVTLLVQYQKLMEDRGTFTYTNNN